MATKRLLLLQLLAAILISAGVSYAQVIDTTTAVDYMYNDLTPGDSITISNGPVQFGSQTFTITSSLYSWDELANKTHVTLNLGGGDTVVVSFSILPAGLTDLTINGGNGADTFTVTPTGVPILINGEGNPQPAPGNVLDVLLAGTTGADLTDTSSPTGLQGSWTFTNESPVNFTGIETVVPEPAGLPLLAAGLGGLLLAGVRVRSLRLPPPGASHPASRARP